MDIKTRKALEASIKHWKANVAAEKSYDATSGASSCALCALFRRPSRDDGACQGCPVREKSGFDFCFGTPFPAAARALENWRMPWTTTMSDAQLRLQWLRAARAELAFLKSLRPKKSAAAGHKELLALAKSIAAQRPHFVAGNPQLEALINGWIASARAIVARRETP